MVVSPSSDLGDVGGAGCDPAALLGTARPRGLQGLNDGL